MLVVLFGSSGAFEKRIAPPGITYRIEYVPVLIALVLALIALVALPIPVVVQREREFLRRLSTTPVAPRWLLAAQVAVDLVLAVVAMVVIVAGDTLLFGVHAPAQGAGFVLAALLATLALFSVGLVVAAIAPTAAAAGVMGTVLLYALMFFRRSLHPTRDHDAVAAPHQQPHATRRGGAGDAQRDEGIFPRRLARGDGRLGGDLRLCGGPALQVGVSGVVVPAIASRDTSLPTSGLLWPCGASRRRSTCGRQHRHDARAGGGGMRGYSAAATRSTPLPDSRSRTSPKTTTRSRRNTAATSLGHLDRDTRPGGDRLHTNQREGHCATERVHADLRPPAESPRTVHTRTRPIEAACYTKCRLRVLAAAPPVGFRANRRSASAEKGDVDGRVPRDRPRRHPRRTTPALRVGRSDTRRLGLRCGGTKAPRRQSPQCDRSPCRRCTSGSCRSAGPREGPDGGRRGRHRARASPNEGIQAAPADRAKGARSIAQSVERAYIRGYPVAGGSDLRHGRSDAAGALLRRAAARSDGPRCGAGCGLWGRVAQRRRHRPRGDGDDDGVGGVRADRPGSSGSPLGCLHDVCYSPHQIAVTYAHPAGYGSTGSTVAARR